MLLQMLYTLFDDECINEASDCVDDILPLYIDHA